MGHDGGSLHSCKWHVQWEVQMGERIGPTGYVWWVYGPNNNRFNVHQHFTCTSANVVYVLVCKRCHILYVGETKRRLADRVTEHLRSIKQNLPGFPVATHFNPPSTCLIRDLMVSAAISCRGSYHDRLAAENRLIMKLGTLSPHGLNVRLELL
ncbi:hypothetical protein HOLleu_32445 [Holothuria leucospilota]|uniref:GIY-YIG domain-containing protein n=1 Tax=Holothuria leucospilota TaxID=206669 RepID=A0A9Q1GYV9_HOLLE|nr:hypothetical protein HOLleu_32445 [Holothuria leucospilota]